MPVSPATARKHTSATETYRGGWRALGERQWRVLCQATDYDAAWGLLLGRMPRQSGEAVVLPGERVP